MTSFKRFTHYKQQQGISLIEVLVALVILVIGLIGVFNLHIVAKRGSFESFQQTQASYFANDIINRMRLNRTELAKYQGNYTGAPTPASKACENTTLCSSSEMQKWDIFEWQSALVGEGEVVGGKNVGGLDSATACVQVSGNNVLVVVVWRGIRKTSISTSAIADISGGCGADTQNRRIYSIKTVII